MKTESKPVEIQLPIVKLRVEDLSWLLGLTKETPEMKCHVPTGNMSRLLILGLVEKYELPPCATRVREFEERRRVASEKLRQAVKPKSIDWSILTSVSWHNMSDAYAPGKREAFRVTPSGRALIKDGIAKVQISKSCK